jgi:hypothetical protein
MKKKVDRRGPSAASLREIPEVDVKRLRRVGVRGRYAHLATGAMVHAVIVDADLWEHFGSARSVNAALRAFVEAQRLIDAERKGAHKGRAA